MACPVGFSSSASPSGAVVGAPVSRHPKLPASIKMLLAPGIMMGLSKLGINYSDPSTILTVRILFGISQATVLAVSLYIAWMIKVNGDTTSIVKVAKGTGKDKKVEYEEKTFRDYDMEQLKKHFQTFFIGVVVTVALHLYANVLPAFILQIVMQPIALWENGLFGAYVLKDPATKRPFIDPSRNPFLKEPEAEEEKKSIETEVSEKPEEKISEKSSEKNSETEETVEDIISKKDEKENTLRKRQVGDVKAEEK